MQNNTEICHFLKWSDLCPWDTYNLVKAISLILDGSLIWISIGLSNRSTWDYPQFQVWFVLFNLSTFDMMCFVHCCLSFFSRILPSHSQFIFDLRVWISLLYHLRLLCINVTKKKTHSVKHLITVPVSISGILTLIATEDWTWVVANKFSLDVLRNHLQLFLSDCEEVQ